MSEERKKVLEMLSEGKISTEEAERLLEKLQEVGARGRGEGRRSGNGWRFRHGRNRHAHDDGDPSANDTAQEESKVRRPRYLRVVVDSDGGENVNIRVPFKLIRTGIKLGAMLPTDARDKIEAKGIDLGSFGEMEVEELIEALNELTVDVEDGKETVRIFCE
jgi:hypothetical protein